MNSGNLLCDERRFLFQNYFNPKYGGKILISEEPINDNSKEEIKQFFRYWLLVKSRGAQEVIHVTHWVEEGEFNKLAANYVNPYIWHPVLRKWTRRE